MGEANRSLVFAISLVCLSTVACGGEVAPDSNVASSAATATASFLVSFESGVIPRNANALVQDAGGTIAARYPNVGALLARSSNASFAAAMRATSGVDAVGASSIVHSAISPKTVVTGGKPPHTTTPADGDPLSFRQWNMDQIHAPQAHAITRGSSSVLVGFLDTGVDVTHPDLEGQVNAAASVSCLGGVPNTSQAIWANDAFGHGTFTSSMVAAKNNGIGIVGVAPAVKLAMVKVVVDDFNDPNVGLVFADAVVCGIEWGIAHNFDLLNASLTIDPFTAPIDDIFCTNEPDRAAVVTIVRKAIRAAAARKLTVVASAGNSFMDLANLPGSTPGVDCYVLPIQLPRVIGVSAVGYTKKLSWYSNYGFNAIDLTAPGGDDLIPNPLVTDTTASGQVLGALPESSFFYQAAADWDGQVQDCTSGTCAFYAYLEGTSAAAPQVTGVAALVISRFGKQEPDELADLLIAGATPLACPPSPYDPGGTGQPATCCGPPDNTNFYGAGEVDALAALQE